MGIIQQQRKQQQQTPTRQLNCIIIDSHIRGRTIQEVVGFVVASVIILQSVWQQWCVPWGDTAMNDSTKKCGSWIVGGDGSNYMMNV